MVFHRRRNKIGHLEFDITAFLIPVGYGKKVKKGGGRISRFPCESSVKPWLRLPLPRWGGGTIAASWDEGGVNFRIFGCEAPYTKREHLLRKS